MGYLGNEIRTVKALRDPLTVVVPEEEKIDEQVASEILKAQSLITSASKGVFTAEDKKRLAESYKNKFTSITNA